MFTFKSLLAATAAATLFSSVISDNIVVERNLATIAKRNEEPAQPSCTDFTPFVYAGCFVDPSTVRGLLYDSQLDSQNMTVEKCVAFCKGVYPGHSFWLPF